MAKKTQDNHARSMVTMETLLPWLLEAEEITWRRGEVGNSFYEMSIESSMSISSEDPVGAAILRHGNTVKHIHSYFSNFEARKCCLHLAGGPTRFTNVRLVGQSAQDADLEEGVMGKPDHRLHVVDRLNEKELAVYRQALLTAQFPVLGAPQPPQEDVSAQSTPTFSAKTYPTFSYNSPFMRDIDSLNTWSSLESSFSFENDELQTSVIPPETLCERLRQSFGLSRERAAQYEKIVYEPYRKRKSRKDSQLDQILAEELSEQLHLLENASHPFYNRKAFLSQAAFDQWQQVQRHILFDLIHKFWPDSQPLPRARSPAHHDVGSYHENYKFLMERIMSYEMSSRRSVGTSSSNLGYLSSASQRLLKEFGLRYGIGELYRGVIYIEFLTSHFECEVGFIGHLTAQLSHLLEVFPSNKQHLVMVLEEWNILYKACAQLHNQCERALSRVNGLLPSLGTDGLRGLIKLLTVVLNMKTYLHRPQRPLHLYLREYTEATFQSWYVKEKELACNELRLDLRANPSSPRLINKMLSKAQEEVTEYKNHYQAVFDEYLDVSGDAARTFYKLLMDDVTTLCTAYRQKDKTSEIQLDLLALAFRLHQLDQDWTNHVPHGDRAWRPLLLSHTLRWLIIVRSHVESLVLQSVAADKFTTLTLPVSGIQEDVDPRAPSTVSIQSLTPSHRSAFSSVRATPVQKVQPLPQAVPDVSQEQHTLNIGKLIRATTSKTGGVTDLSNNPEGDAAFQSRTLQTQVDSAFTAVSSAINTSSHATVSGSSMMGKDTGIGAETETLHTVKQSDLFSETNMYPGDSELPLVPEQSSNTRQSLPCDSGEHSAGDQVELLQNDHRKSESQTSSGIELPESHGNISLPQDIQENPSYHFEEGSDTQMEEGLDSSRTESNLAFSDIHSQSLCIETKARKLLVMGHLHTKDIFTDGIVDSSEINDNVKTTSSSLNVKPVITNDIDVNIEASIVKKEIMGKNGTQFNEDGSTEAIETPLEEQLKDQGGHDGENNVVKTTETKSQKEVVEMDKDNIVNTTGITGENDEQQNKQVIADRSSDNAGAQSFMKVQGDGKQEEGDEEYTSNSYPNLTTVAQTQPNIVVLEAATGENMCEAVDTASKWQPYPSSQPCLPVEVEVCLTGHGEQLNPEHSRIKTFHHDSKPFHSNIDKSGTNETYMYGDIRSSEDRSFSTVRRASRPVIQDPINGDIMMSGSAVDVTCILVRLVHLVETLCQTLCPFPDVQPRNMRTDLKSTEPDTQAGPGCGPLPSQADAAERLLRECVKSREQLYGNLVQILSSSMCMYANNILCMDLCGLWTGEAKNLIGSQLLNEVNHDYAQKKVWGCRHMTPGSHDCDYYSRKRHERTAKFLADCFEPITQQMCTRLNNLQTLAEVVPYFESEAGEAVEITRIKAVAEELEMHADEQTVNDYLVVEMFPSLPASAPRLHSRASTSSHGSCHSDCFKVNDLSRVVFGHCRFHLESVLEGVVHLMAYRMNLFFREGLTLLLGFSFPMLSVEKQMAPLVEFLERHLVALKDWLYSKCFERVASTLWDYMAQDFEEKTLSLQRYTGNTNAMATNMLQTLTMFIRFFRQHIPSLSLDYLASKVSKVSHWLQLYTQSTQHLLFLHRHLAAAAENSEVSTMDHRLPNRQFLQQALEDLHAEKKCFSGQQFISWLLQHAEGWVPGMADLYPVDLFDDMYPDQSAAQNLAQTLMDSGIVSCVDEDWMSSSIQTRPSSIPSGEAYPKLTEVHTWPGSTLAIGRDTTPLSYWSITSSGQMSRGMRSYYGLAGSYEADDDIFEEEESDLGTFQEKQNGPAHMEDRPARAPEADSVASWDGSYAPKNLNTSRSSSFSAQSITESQVLNSEMTLEQTDFPLLGGATGSSAALPKPSWFVSEDQDRDSVLTIDSDSTDYDVFQNSDRHFYCFSSIIDPVTPQEVEREPRPLDSPRVKSGLLPHITNSMLQAAHQWNAGPELILAILNTRRKRDKHARTYLQQIPSQFLQDLSGITEPHTGCFGFL